MEATAQYLRAAADLIHTNGLWTGDGLADPFGAPISPEAAIYQASAGYLPFAFCLPGDDAVAVGRSMIEARPDVMAAITGLASHIDVNTPGTVPDDPIEALAGWVRWPQMTAAEVIGRILAVADLLDRQAGIGLADAA